MKGVREDDVFLYWIMEIWMGGNIIIRNILSLSSWNLGILWCGCRWVKIGINFPWLSAHLFSSSVRVAVNIAGGKGRICCDRIVLVYLFTSLNCSLGPRFGSYLDPCSSLERCSFCSPRLLFSGRLWGVGLSAQIHDSVWGWRCGCSCGFIVFWRVNASPRAGL